MTFFLDHDVPEDITHSLLALGHRVTRLREVLPKEAGDQQVLAYVCQAKSFSLHVTGTTSSRWLSLSPIAASLS